MLSAPKVPPFPGAGQLKGTVVHTARYPREGLDVKEAPIECFTESGLKTSAGHYDLDIVILATGFDAGTGALTRMNVFGRDGLSLTEQWSKDIRSTLGLQVHGFPNLFTVAGTRALRSPNVPRHS